MNVRPRGALLLDSMLKPSALRKAGLALIAIAWLASASLSATMTGGRAGDDYPARVIPYDLARYPHIDCLAGRVLAETRPGLSAREREALWRAYGVKPSFQWLVPATGFSYHELEVKPYPWWQLAWAALSRRELPPRALPELVALLNEDPRIDWAAPDALLLDWAQPRQLPPGEELIDDDVSQGDALATEKQAQPRAAADATGEERGVNFVDPYFRPLPGGFSAWQKDDSALDPVPDFEYYRLCAPEGTAVNWAAELRSSNKFTEHCARAYGINEALALARYRQAGSPPLSSVTVVVADTGVAVNHPDLAGRLHPNAIDANLRNYRVRAPDDRPAAELEISDRRRVEAVGLPRMAIADRPAAHGTATAGIVARCTSGFGHGGDAVRILPASIKTASTMRFSGPNMHVKSPVSSFIKLIACLYQQFPTGDFAEGDGAVRNRGDVRVVTTSASMPRTYFSDAEWKVVAPVIGKAAGSIAEDLRQNDRVYLFASGNEALGWPSRPGEMDYVISVAAAMPFDGARAWYRELTKEGSNLGEKCVSAPGYGVITSTIQPSPNLNYLREGEFPPPVPHFSTPPRAGSWTEQTYRFSATSASTPQVAALAALLYAEHPERSYKDVIQLVEDSTGGRKISSEWGEARGLVDYSAALGW